MPDRRVGNGLPLFALTLFFSGVAAAIGVLSFPPPDRPDLPGIYPQPLGELGYELRSGLIDPLGAAVYVFIVGWIIVAVAMLRGRRWPAWSRRAAGWLLLTAPAAVGADWFGPERLGGPLTGTGGSVGAFVAVWLDKQLPRSSAIIVLVAVGLLGAVLAADRIVLKTVRLLRAVVRPLGRLARAAICF